MHLFLPAKHNKSVAHRADDNAQEENAITTALHGFWKTRQKQAQRAWVFLHRCPQNSVSEPITNTQASASELVS